MKNAILWDVTQWGPCKNRVSDDRIASIISVTRIVGAGTLKVTSNRIVYHIVFLRRVLRLLVTAIVLSWPISVTLMTEAISSSETSVFARAARRNIPEDILQWSPP
jgi:hypothetical protein